jgi:hypothetical protein
MKTQNYLVLVLFIYGLKFGLIDCIAAADTLQTPHQIIAKLQDRMYVVGETNPQLDRYVKAEAEAVQQIRDFASNKEEDAAFIEKNNIGQTPLIAAAFMGYSEIVAELLNQQNVKDSINDVNPKGMTAWMYANFASRQSMWSCNPTAFDNPFVFVPLFVTQPYYTESSENPYKKIRRLLEVAGAQVNMQQAKQIWLDTCKLAEASTRQRVESADDLLEAVLADGKEKLAAFMLRQREREKMARQSPQGKVTQVQSQDGIPVATIIDSGERPGETSYFTTKLLTPKPKRPRLKMPLPKR